MSLHTFVHCVVLHIQRSHLGRPVPGRERSTVSNFVIDRGGNGAERIVPLDTDLIESLIKSKRTVY